MSDFDLVVVGAGAGGLTTASESKKLGLKRIAIVSNDRPGGDCSYYGCVPSKTLIHSAKVLDYARRAHEFGLPRLNVKPDFAKVAAHRDKIMNEITARGSWKPWENQGFTVVRGTGRFVSPDEIAVGRRRLTADRYVLAVGTEAAVPPVPGLKEAGYLTNVEAVALKSLPPSLLILGAGPIGAEFAQIFSRFGSRVTLVEMAGHILPQEDPEVTALLTSYLRDEGIDVREATKVERIETRGKKKVAIGKGPGGEVRCVADEIVVATGRKPATAGIGLDAAGVKLDKNGYVKTDDGLRTDSRKIWAVGDCTGKFLFTHVADYQARVAAKNLASNGRARARVDYSVVPWATFTDPELARVGLSEPEAREKKVAYRTGSIKFSDVERAHMMLEQKGMIKVVASKGGKILGATVLGAHADDLIHEFAVAIKAGMKTSDILGMIHAYPSLSEAVRWSMWSFEPKDSTGV